MKLPAFLSITPALGDLICATPTIRKLSQVYGCKVLVISNHPQALEGLPYVSESLHINEVDPEKISRQYDLHRTFHLLGKQDNLGIEFKHAVCDIRQFHAKDLGFMLKDDELTCDYATSKDVSCIREFNLPEKYVVIHPAKSWDSRTWEHSKWQELANRFQEKGIFVVSIGKDSGEYTSQGVLDKPAFGLDFTYGADLTNKTDLDQSWHIINGADAVITMDSGVLHLAGTTDTFIIQLGSNIDPTFRAPYRKSKQSYKYQYVLGGCSIHCASDMKYSLRDWGGIQNVTLIDTCLQEGMNYGCKPSVEQVFQAYLSIQNNPENAITTTEPIQKQVNDDGILIKIASGSLGDTIGAMTVISSFQKNKGVPVHVICNLEEKYFKNSYPELKFYPHQDEPIFDNPTGFYKLNDKYFSQYQKILYIFDQPLIKGYADQLSVIDWERPKIDYRVKQRPIKSKYACFSMHSTAQCKNWNYPDAWDKLCRLLRKEGITPVCIDRNPGFGIEGWWNDVPTSAVKKPGMDLEEMSNYIHHSEFFIGISSGLSWVAHSIGKKVVMVSGVTSEDNEFSQDTIRIMNKNVCHGCINKTGISFDAGDWLWCPLHKGTERQFECTTSISPEEVFRVIKENLL